MSHIVSIETQVRDPVAITAACDRLGLAAPSQGTFQLFAGEVTGTAIQLPGWKYPVVCRVDEGRIDFDHYEGRWGDPKELDRFLQAYGVEKVKIEARRQGKTVAERLLTDGSIKLTIQAGGQL